MVELKDVLQCYGLQWKQVTSILLDNCAVVGGKHSAKKVVFAELPVCMRGIHRTPCSLETFQAQDFIFFTLSPIELL